MKSCKVLNPGGESGVRTFQTVFGQDIRQDIRTGGNPYRPQRRSIVTDSANHYTERRMTHILQN
jgi:hypothetical protein